MDQIPGLLLLDLATKKAADERSQVKRSDWEQPVAHYIGFCWKESVVLGRLQLDVGRKEVIYQIY
jgi:hypothetical protein